MTTNKNKTKKGVLANATCVTSCPVITTESAIGGKATPPMASPCGFDVTDDKVKPATLTAAKVRQRKCVSFVNAIERETVDRIRYDDGSTPKRLSSFPLWTMPLAGETKGRLLDIDGNKRLEYFELDRWLCSHDAESCKTLSDRCLALRDARILSEDVGTWHQPGEHKVYDTNRCRNVARHMNPGLKREGCLVHKVETNNKLDNCFGWPVLWVDNEAWFYVRRDSKYSDIRKGKFRWEPQLYTRTKAAMTIWRNPNPDYFHLWTTKDSDYEWGDLRSAADQRISVGLDPISEVKDKSLPAFHIDAKGHFKSGSYRELPDAPTSNEQTIYKLIPKWLFDSGSGLDVIGLDALSDYLDYLFEADIPITVGTANGKTIAKYQV